MPLFSPRIGSHKLADQTLKPLISFTSLYDIPAHSATKMCPLSYFTNLEGTAYLDAWLPNGSFFMSDLKPMSFLFGGHQKNI